MDVEQHILFIFMLPDFPLTGAIFLSAFFSFVALTYLENTMCFFKLKFPVELTLMFDHVLDSNCTLPQNILVTSGSTGCHTESCEGKRVFQFVHFIITDFPLEKEEQKSVGRQFENSHI